MPVRSLRRRRLAGLALASAVAGILLGTFFANYGGAERYPGRMNRSAGAASLFALPSTTAASRRARVAAQYERLEPQADGWETEAAGDEVAELLDVVGKLLANPDTIDNEHLDSVMAPECRSGFLRPADLSTAYEDRCVLVRRGGAESPAGGELSLRQALLQLAAPLAGATDVRVKFKVFRVAEDGGAIETSAYYQSAGKFDRGAVQQGAIWHCRWLRTPTGLRLASLQAENYEETANKQGRSGWLADCTQAVIGDNACYREQLLYDMDYWKDRIDAVVGTDPRGHQGLAIGDVNGDGLEDVYLCQSGGLPNRLFIQQDDGTAVEQAAEAGVDLLENTKCALLVDLDNDGDLDLMAGLNWGLVAMENDGRGRFSQRDRIPHSSTPYSLAAADFDNDRDLDVYVCIYTSEFSLSGVASPVPYHDANNGGRNLLLENLGNWRFINAVKRVGLNENNSRFSLAAAWEDYDNDGDLDLYVANDFGRNNLYQNEGGQFRDVAAEAGVEDIAAGMSVSWGDYNLDGWMDLYISNMFSSAGGRIAYQRAFQADADEETREALRRHARGNTLFENAGDGTFRDVSESAGVTLGRWAWGSLFVDLNNDGREDIYVTNGMLTRAATHDL